MKLSKRILSLVLVCVFAMSFLACGTASEEPAADPASVTARAAEAGITKSKDTTYISVAAASPGGMFNNIAAAYVSIFEEAMNVNLTVLPGGAAENYKTVSKGEAELGFVHSTTSWMGANGTGPYDQVYSGVTAIAPVFPAAMQVVVRADSKIQDFSELYNKNVGFGIVGGTGNYFIQQYLEEEYGITPESIEANGGSVSYLAESECANTLADGQVDVMTSLGTYPRTSIQSIEKTPGIRLLKFDEEKLDHYLANHPEWTKFIIPGNAYEGNPDPIASVTTFSVLACQESLDAEFVYNLTKTLWTFQEDAGIGSVEVRDWMKIEDVNGITSAMKLHPGAERYYKEVGILD